MNIWGVDVPENTLDQEELAYLKPFSKMDLPEIDSIWNEMDRVWDHYRINNLGEITPEEFQKFYSHPVWILNGIYTKADPISSGHRASISKFIKNLADLKILDYGGGFGELACMISSELPAAQVEIFEPHPSMLGLEILKGYPNVHYVDEIDGSYGVIIAQDVLEHVTDPIDLAAQLIRAVPVNGYVIFANCFHPVIKCHLPRTFHLRHMFQHVVGPLGLKNVGFVPGAEHVHVYQRVSDLMDVQKARKVERISKFIGPIWNGIRSRGGKIYRFFKGS